MSHSKENWVEVGLIGDFSPEGRLVVDCSDRSILILNVNSKYYAIDELCTHADFSLEHGEIEECCIYCPFHGAKFSIETGEALSPPAFKNLKTYSVKEDDMGRIWINLPDHSSVGGSQPS